MRTEPKWRRLALAAAGCLLLVLSGTAWSAAPGRTDQGARDRALDKEINATLRTVINKGADLYNLQGDQAGCYRLYQGALIAVRPLLDHHPKLQKSIDDGLTQAEAIPLPLGQAGYAQKAFALRRVLDEVRASLKGGAAGTTQKAPDTTEKTPEPPEPGPKVAEKKTEAPKTPEKATLWQRLGGEAKVKRIVDDFARRAENDPQVNFTRGGEYKVNNKELKKAMVHLISQYTGGPLTYTGPNMKAAHKGMKITNAEFDASVEDFRKALADNRVPQAAAEELLELIEQTRPAIVRGSGGDTAPKKTETEPKGEEPEKKSSPDNEPKKSNSEGAASADLGGRVLFDGKPAPAGLLILLSAEGKPYSTFVRADGFYRFKRQLPAGQYRVGYQEVGEGDEKGISTGRVPAPASESRVPARYQRPQTSGLTVELQRGNNTANFDLEK